MSGFSGIVRISNVSDFIEPSQKCVLPMAGATVLPAAANLVSIHAKTRGDGAGRVPPPRADEKVKVTLADCLACSGCITTAETMLVESQTVEQMLKGFAVHSLSFVTVSPQSLASLAVHHGMTPSVAAVRLTRFLSALGAHHVVDSSFGRQLSRRLIYEEWRRTLAVGDGGDGTAAAKHRPPPLLTGVCPGFVCYAEKTHGERLVGRLSRVRSPQAVAGALAKDWLARRLSIAPADVFHVAVAPCYDKKLEASRVDFVWAGDVHEVDCVVTASELVTLIDSSAEYKELFLATASADADEPSTSTASSDVDNMETGWLSWFGAGRPLGDANDETSGGYADYVARRLLADFPGASMTRVRRNKDLEEFLIFAPAFGDDPLVVAKLYGFRNIQNAVLKLKRDKLRLDFAEVMACPSGCGNGGGQIRGESTEERARLTAAVGAAYAQLCVDNERAVVTTLDALLADWRRLNPDYESMLYTEYHALAPSLATALGGAW